MKTNNLAAVALVVAGILGLAYGGFTYTRQTHSIDMGSLHMEMNERQRVNIPLWAGLAAIGGGLLLFAVGRRP